MTTAERPNVQYVRGEEFQPTRKYLNASNWFFLALKVFGYNLLGWVCIVIPFYLILALLVGL